MPSLSVFVRWNLNAKLVKAEVPWNPGGLAAGTANARGDISVSQGHKVEARGRSDRVKPCDGRGLGLVAHDQVTKTFVHNEPDFAALQIVGLNFGFDPPLAAGVANGQLQG